MLLACQREPEQIEERPALDELLADLDREQLRDILLRLAANDPDAGRRDREPDRVESSHFGYKRTDVSPRVATAAHAGRSPTFSPPGQGHPALLDRMRPSEAYWHVSSVVDQVRQLLHQVQHFIEAGDGGNALLLLEALTDAYVADWTRLDDSSGFAGEFFEELGEAWTEAGLIADHLDSKEREQWAERLTRWQAEISEYGIDDAFDAAQAALYRGGIMPLCSGSCRARPRTRARGKMMRPGTPANSL